MARRGTDPYEPTGVRRRTCADRRTPAADRGRRVRRERWANHGCRATRHDQSAGGATVIDVRGKTIMPAIVDAHSHLGIHRCAHRHHGGGELHARQPARSAPALRVLRHRRDIEPWPRSRRDPLSTARARPQRARRCFSPPDAASPCRTPDRTPTTGRTPPTA